MSAQEAKENVVREFKLTTLALKNKNTVFLLSLIIFGFGILSYIRLPKELFPEVVFPTILVQTTYFGNPPIDIENLVTRPLEKEIEMINGIKEINSTSAQDASMIFVEFNTDVNVQDALLDVKDAVDKAKSELPDDRNLIDPVVMDFDFGEFPIININLSGDYSTEELRDHAEFLEDKFESIQEVSKVELKGVDDREIKINVDLRKMESYGITFEEIEYAVSAENVSVSGGEILLGDTRRAIRTIGEFENMDEIRNIVVKEENERVVYLKDIAEVIDGYADPTSFARLNRQPVVSLQVVKKSGENLLAATDQVFKVLDEAEKNHSLPENLNVTITNDQSDMIRMQLNNLENNMIFAVILVVLVLFYFLGTRNALFVGLAIPMSMMLSFVVINIIDYKINMIVLFSLILALGLLVDNAIVVVENIYRHVHEGKKPVYAARVAIGEVALPIISSTLTTLAAFLPLAFWEGITGEFMKYLPVTLIIVLLSSLVVALVFIPVFSSSLIKTPEQENNTNKDKSRKKGFYIAVGMIVLSIPLFIAGARVFPNLLVIGGLIGILDLLFFNDAQTWFRESFLPKIEKYYYKILVFALYKKRPYAFFGGTVLLLILTVMFYMARLPNVTFFPEAEPSYVNVIADLPVGTDIRATNDFTKRLEKDLYQLLEEDMDIVESVLTTVGEGSGGDFSDFGSKPTKSVTTITFVDYEDRGGKSTSEIMKNISTKLVDRYPGVQMEVEKNEMGPPAGRPINIEVSGEDIDRLYNLVDSMMNEIEAASIEGIEGLQMNLEVGKPELMVKIDREKARRFGLSTSQIATTIRTALFGKEISDYKEGEDEYPIQLRLQDEYRYDLPALLNQKISIRDEGRLIQIPISSVADFEYSTTYGSIRRLDLNRVVTIYSNVIEGYNANNINEQIKLVLKDFEIPDGYRYQFTGEQEEQAESAEFLMNAMMLALALILLILVTQFNSLIKPLIILASVVFSTIGVFGGLATFKMDFVIVMTGIGIVSLAGIVVNNAIVLIDYIELLKREKREELGLQEDAFLPLAEATDCVVRAGETRLRPVLLTAITTILGLIPMAIGVNLDFAGLLKEYAPNFYIGGEMVALWGPISWTVIFGLTFATFLTLVIVPVMYRLSVIAQKKALHLLGMDTGENIENQKK